MFRIIPDKQSKFEWNPQGALAAVCEAESYAIRAEQLEHGLQRLAGSEAVSKLVRYDEGKISIPDYVDRLRGQQQQAMDIHFQLGGPQAARVALGRVGTHSYAGEVPPVPETPHEITYPNFPA